jgi:hypothetical protein
MTGGVHVLSVSRLASVANHSDLEAHIWLLEAAARSNLIPRSKTGLSGSS